MNTKRIIVRVDGDSQIGLGHLIRCIALAQMLKDDYYIHFLSKFAPESIIQDIQKMGFGFTKIKHENSVFTFLNERDIVVIDHYDLDFSYQKQIKNLGCKLVCIDDLHDKSFVADLIINHAPGVESKHYDAMPYTKFALGPQFALLRPEFLNLALSNSQRCQNRKLIICFGGSDFNNLTCSSIELFESDLFFDEITVITGQSYPHRDQLRKLVSRSNRIKWYENLNAHQMVTHLKNCQFVLAPASSIAYELLSAGCTWLGGYYVENQKMIYNGFKQLNCMVDLGNINLSFASILSKIKNADFKYLCKENPIDGKSGFRIKELFSTLC